MLALGSAPDMARADMSCPAAALGKQGEGGGLLKACPSALLTVYVFSAASFWRERTLGDYGDEPAEEGRKERAPMKQL